MCYAAQLYILNLVRSSSTKFSTHVYYSSVDRLFAHQLIIEILAHAHLIIIEILDQSFARAVYSCVVDSCILLVEYMLLKYRTAVYVPPDRVTTAVQQ